MPNTAHLLAALPIEFVTGDAIRIGTAMGIKERTIEKYLPMLALGGQLQKIQHGHYKKA